MDLLYTNPNAAVNSDLAFWGNHAFIGYYTGDAAPRGGVRSSTSRIRPVPRSSKTSSATGFKNDPIIWDRNGNGVADLLLLAVDRTMEGPSAGLPGR